MTQALAQIYQKKIIEKQSMLGEYDAALGRLKDEYDAILAAKAEDEQALEELVGKLRALGEQPQEPASPPAHPLDRGGVRKPAVQPGAPPWVVPAATAPPPPVVDREPPPRPIPREPFSLTPQEIAAQQLYQEPNFSSNVHAQRGLITEDMQYVDDSGQLQEGV